MLSKNKEWANDCLRYGISVLQGHEYKANLRTITSQTIERIEELERAGYWWQAKILGHWLNRFKRGDFTARRADPPQGGQFTINPEKRVIDRAVDSWELAKKIKLVHYLEPYKK